MKCCEQMQSILEEGKIEIGYASIYREYYINDKYSNYAIQLINHCPWCGVKLPKNLRNEWFDILEKEYGIETNIGEARDRKDIPQEFRTDEWWKKRGL